MIIWIYSGNYHEVSYNVDGMIVPVAWIQTQDNCN
jgi:hypothetical protein